MRSKGRTKKYGGNRSAGRTNLHEEEKNFKMAELKIRHRFNSVLKPKQRLIKKCLGLSGQAKMKSMSLAASAFSDCYICLKMSFTGTYASYSRMSILSAKEGMKYSRTTWTEPQGYTIYFIFILFVFLDNRGKLKTDLGCQTDLSGTYPVKVTYPLKPLLLLCPPGCSHSMSFARLFRI